MRSGARVNGDPLDSKEQSKPISLQQNDNGYLPHHFDLAFMQRFHRKIRMYHGIMTVQKTSELSDEFPTMRLWERVLLKTGLKKTQKIRNAVSMPDPALFFPLRFRYRMKVMIATTTKMMTSHFAISIVKPAIPFMPMIKNTRARIRNTTAR
jgi:hypothetical protein